MVTRILATCLLAGGLAVATAGFAGDAQGDSGSAAVAKSGQKNKGSQKRVDSQINRLSKKVDLTSDQKDQLRSQLAKSNQNTHKLWQQFAKAHVQVIRLEAEMTAALEDVLEPEQQMQTKKNRQAKASSDSHSKKAESKADSAKTSASTKKPVKNGSSTSNKDSSQAKSSATNKKSDKTKGNKLAAKNKDKKSATTKDSGDDQDETEEYVWTMVIVPVQEELNPLGLSVEQELQADQILSNYHNKIVKGWQKIDQLHDQLVAIEAQSVLDVEKVLTKDQRKKLMSTRKNSNAKKHSSKPKSKS